jgi:hypothetical protein
LKDAETKFTELPDKIVEQTKSQTLKDATETFDVANAPVIQALLVIVGALQLVDQIAQAIVDNVAFK